jgi:hypothetical protein
MMKKKKEKFRNYKLIFGTKKNKIILIIWAKKKIKNKNKENFLKQRMNKKIEI